MFGDNGPGLLTPAHQFPLTSTRSKKLMWKTISLFCMCFTYKQNLLRILVDFTKNLTILTRLYFSRRVPDQHRKRMRCTGEWVLWTLAWGVLSQVRVSARSYEIFFSVFPHSPLCIPWQSLSIYLKEPNFEKSTPASFSTAHLSRPWDGVWKHLPLHQSHYYNATQCGVDERYYLVLFILLSC